MDLGTIKSNLESRLYPSAAACADDVRLVWRNCCTYNAEGSDFHRLGEQLSMRFEERFQRLISEFGESVICGGEGGTGGSAAGSSGRKSRSNSLTSGGRLTPPPGGRASHIVPLDVRARFAARLQRLSGMELGHVMSTIDIQCPEALEDPAEDELRSDDVPKGRRHPYSWDQFNGGTQIEIDVDAIPADTFWRLDKYVKDKVANRGKGAWSQDVDSSYVEPPPSKKKKT